MHSEYGGCNSNASLESMWKNKPDICPPSAPLGTMLGGLVHTIQELGKEYEAKLKLQGHPNQFTSIPKVRKEVWDQIVSRHPKSMACVVLCSIHKELFVAVTKEIYEVGDVLTPLHLKIEQWHAEMKRNGETCLLNDDEEM